MSRKLTASDRKNLIRLASSLPKGSEERRAILAGLGKKAASQIILPIPVEYDSGLSADELFGMEEDEIPGSTVERILAYLGARDVRQLKTFGGPDSVIESPGIVNEIFKKGKVLGKVMGDNGDVDAIAGTIGKMKVVLVDDYYPGFFTA